jgi:hypothetical protein
VGNSGASSAPVVSCRTLSRYLLGRAPLSKKISRVSLYSWLISLPPSRACRAQPQVEQCVLNVEADGLSRETDSGRSRSPQLFIAHLGPNSRPAVISVHRDFSLFWIGQRLGGALLLRLLGLRGSGRFLDRVCSLSLPALTFQPRDDKMPFELAVVPYRLSNRPRGEWRAAEKALFHFPSAARLTAHDSPSNHSRTPHLLHPAKTEKSIDSRTLEWASSQP